MTSEEQKDNLTETSEAVSSNTEPEPVQENLAEKVENESEIDQDIPAVSLTEEEQQIESLKQALEVEKKASKEAQEKMLRTLAEFENFKKRKETEKDEAIKFSLKSFFENFLPVLDSFDQASHTFDTTKEDSKALKDGFQLIQQQLHSLLEKNGVVKIQASDQVFDPNLHQAVMQEEVDGVASQTIIRVMQEGYMYHERVLRPAMVVVAQ